MSANFNFHRFPLMPVLLVYIVGVLFQVFVLQISNANLLLILFAIYTLLLLFFAKFSGENKWGSMLLRSFLWLGVFGLGIMLTALHDVRNQSKWYGHESNQYEAYSVKIVESPKEKARTFLLPVEVQYGMKDDKWQQLNGRLQVYVYKSEALPNFQIGQQWLIPANVVAIKHNNNPGSFNFAEKQQKKGLYFQCFLNHQQLMLVQDSRHVSWISNTRAHLLHQLDTFITDPITRSLTQATLLNEADNMDAQMQKDYAATGISHIIAISGMHVNLLFGLMVLPFFWMKDKRKQWIKYLSVLPLVWLYVALCNFPPSAVRAALGFSLITISMLVKRPQNNIYLLCLNAFVLLLFNPMWLFHVGVQLSFLAVLSIFIFYPVLKKRYSSKWKILNWIWDTIAVSLAVQILVFPLVIFYFHQFPIWFLLANVMAALFSVLQMGMAFGIMLFGVMKLTAVAGFIAFVLERMTLGFNVIIAWLNAHSWDLSRSIPMDGADFVLIMICIVTLSIFFLRKQKLFLFIGLSFSVGFVLNLFFNDFKASKQQRIIVYASTRQTVVDVMKGKATWTYIDSLAENVDQFALRPAQLKFRISKVQQMPVENTFWLIGTKKIAMISDASQLPDTTIDVLILSNEADLQTAQIQASLGNPLIVLDGSWGRSVSIRYATRLREQGMAVHNTQSDGAWWFYAK